MNTNHHKQLMFNLVKDIIDRHNPSSMQYCLASYILAEAEQGKATAVEDSGILQRYQKLVTEYDLLLGRYSSLMQDFHDKCDELTTLQEEHDELGSHYDALTATLEQHKNSKAALQRDYDQLKEALSLKNSECVDLTAERDRLRAANDNGTEVLAKTRDELAFLQDQLDGYHGKHKNPKRRPKRELKDDESPNVEEFVWVNPPEVGER